MSSKPGRAVAAALLLLTVPVAAEDENAGVRPGAFRTEPAGAATLGAVRVDLDGDRVRVDLALTLRGAAAIRLDLPRFGWLGQADTYPDRQFPELKVEIDGRVVTPAEQVVALAAGRDISAALADAGVDPFAIAQTPPFVEAAPGKQPQLDALLASGAVKRVPEGLFATWTAQRTVRVTPGAGAHRVAFRYAARPAYVLAPLAGGGIRWADYCASPALAKQAMARHRLSGPVLIHRYAIPVTLDSARPRALTLRAPSPSGSVTIVCGAGGRALIDPAGAVAVRPGADGAVHVLRLSPPGSS